MARLEDKLAAHARPRTASSVPEMLFTPRETLTELPLGQIEPDPHQPRKELGDLTELKASIGSVGFAQPIVVRIVGFERYQIIMGERRFTAAKELGLPRIPAIVRASLEEHQRLELQLVENLHRKDLNPLEEAESFRRLLEEFDLTQEELGRRLGRSQVSISETLRLLKLPETILKEYRTSDTVSKSLLLEIAKQPDVERQRTMWMDAKRGELTVKKARDQKAVNAAPSRSKVPKSMAFRYPITTDHAQIMLTFTEAKVDQEDIIEALEQALEQERARLTATSG
jgi:ParB family transcriptional regulator, chromosome partitioning protein